MPFLPKVSSSLTSQIIVGMLLGIVVGSVGGSEISGLGVFGKLLIQLIKAIAIPLVFVSIFDAIISTEITWKSCRQLLGIIVINSTAAIVIALGLANLFHPGEGLDFRGQEATLGLSGKTELPTKKFSALEIVISHIPSSIVHPFMENNIIGVVLIALLCGFAARQVTELPGQTDRATLEKGTRFLVKIFERMLSWLVKLTPLAVFGVTAKTVGEHGLSPFRGLAVYVVIVLLGLTIQAVLVYQLWIRAVAGISLATFWSRAKEALFYAFGTNSSLATLPLTLKTLDELGVPKSSSRLGACVGTNLNNDGIILYEAMAVIFVAQAHGMDLSLSEQLSTMLLCLLAAIGVAGVPEAGIISLSLVLSAVNLPLDILPLLLTVDWLIARCRSVTNVLADMTVSIALAGQERKLVTRSD